MSMKQNKTGINLPPYSIYLHAKL